MAGAAPKTKIHDITSQINHMGNHLMDGGKLDLMVWHRLVRELESMEAKPELLKVALLPQAVLWGFKDDLPKVQRIFNLYAGKIGKDLEWHMTRANMAPMFGNLSFLTEMLESGYPKGSKEGLLKAIAICSQAGLFVSALKAITDLGKLDSEASVKALEEYPFVGPAARYLKGKGVPEVEVARRVVAASRVMLDHKSPLTRYSVNANETGILFEFIVDAEVDRLVDLNLAVADAVAEQFEDTLSHHLGIGVTPKEEAA